MSKSSITGTPLKLVWSNYSTIYESSYSYKSACKVLKNSYLKCGGVLHTNFWWNIIGEKGQ